MADDAAPTQIGSYPVIRELTATTIGRQFLVSHENNHWALQRLDPTRARLGQAAYGLVGDAIHDAMVRYLDVHADTNEAWVVSDFLNRPPVTADALADRPAGDRIRFLANLVAGIAVLHGKDIVHGWIAPEHVLLVGGGKQALLLAAGIAPLPKRLPTRMALDAVYGTMAPELIQAHQEDQDDDHRPTEAALTPAADVYAAGCMVARLLAGSDPFADCRDVREILERKRAGPVLCLGNRSRSSTYDASKLRDAIAAATHPDPDQRLATASALHDALEASLAVPNAA